MGFSADVPKEKAGLISAEVCPKAVTCVVAAGIEKPDLGSILGTAAGAPKVKLGAATGCVGTDGGIAVDVEAAEKVNGFVLSAIEGAAGPVEIDGALKEKGLVLVSVLAAVGGAAKLKVAGATDGWSDFDPVDAASTPAVLVVAVAGAVEPKLNRAGLGSAPDSLLWAVESAGVDENVGMASGTVAVDACLASGSGVFCLVTRGVETALLGCEPVAKDAFFFRLTEEPGVPSRDSGSIGRLGVPTADSTAMLGIRSRPLTKTGLGAAEACLMPLVPIEVLAFLPGEPIEAKDPPLPRA